MSKNKTRVACPYCGWDYPENKLEQHKKVCIESPHKGTNDRRFDELYKIGLGSLIICIISIMVVFFIFIVGTENTGLSFMLILALVFRVVAWIISLVITFKLKKTPFFVVILLLGMIPVIVFYIIYKQLTKFEE